MKTHRAYLELSGPLSCNPIAVATVEVTDDGFELRSEVISFDAASDEDGEWADLDQLCWLAEREAKQVWAAQG